MDVAVLFSGGKDSTMAVWAALEAKEDVKYLLSVKSRNDESYMFHVPNIHITDLLAQALEIPLMSVETDGIKEEELKDLKAAFQDLKDLGVEAIYTGALYSVYQKSRIEKLGDEVGLKIISPFWHVDELEYMRKIVSLGFKIIISGVAAWGLDESWLGREIDEECIGELVRLQLEHVFTQSDSPIELTSANICIKLVESGIKDTSVILHCPIFELFTHLFAVFSILVTSKPIHELLGS